MSLRRLFAVLFVIASFCASVPSSAGATTSGGWPSRPATTSRQHPKLAPALDDQAHGLRPAGEDTQPDSSGRIVVAVYGPTASGIAAAVEQAQGTVRTAVKGFDLAWVPVGNLGALSDDARVTSVEVPHALKSTLTSQGVAQINANTWQNASLDGTGVKVGIVDVGFQNLTTEQNASRMPAVTTRSFCSNGIDGSTNHGTAVSEIVHQVAPNAQLFLVCVTFDADIVSAEQYLATQGVSVVNASITSVLSSRGDGSGIVGDAMNAGRAAGQLWSVAAGNDGDRHFAFNAVDTDNDGAVEMTGGAFPGPDGTELFSFTLPSNGTINLGAKYDAWPITNQEFDVCVWTAGLGTFFGCQGTGQEASPKDPTTGFFQAGMPAGSYQLAIFRGPHTTIAPRMDLFFEGNESNLQRVNAAGSIGDPGTSPSVMTVGAYNVTGGALETFSSQGPTIDGRRKPDIAGPDGVANDIFNPFFGTSASAPHGTGAAALVKDKLPNATPAQIQTFLECRATDAGPAGVDNQFGYGKLSLGSVPTSQDLAAMNPAVVRSTTIFERSGRCTGIADTVLNYGAPGDIVLLCDWDGNGTRTPGAFRNGRWFLRNAPGNGPADQPTFVLGDPGDIPVCGHWNGSGPDTAGVFRNGSFFLKFANTSGFADVAFRYGDPGDLPVTGDWDGNGSSTVGVFRNGTWFLRNATGGGFSDIPPIRYGDPGDIPVVGDWDGNGSTTMGVFRKGTWFLRNDNTGGFSTLPTFFLGDTGDRPQAWH